MNFLMRSSLISKRETDRRGPDDGVPDDGHLASASSPEVPGNVSAPEEHLKLAEHYRAQSKALMKESRTWLPWQTSMIETPPAIRSRNFPRTAITAALYRGNI